MIEFDDIIIKVFPAKTQSAILGFAAITFPIQIGAQKTTIKIGGFLIMEDRFRGGYRVEPPKIMSKPKPQMIFFLEDKDLWRRLENEVTKRFEGELKKQELQHPPDCNRNHNY